MIPPHSLFLDFESDTKDNFYLAGMEIDGNFEQIILDYRLEGLGAFRNLNLMTIQSFLEKICSEYTNLTIYGYSIHERDVFNEFIKDPKLRNPNFTYVNLLKAAKSWIFKCHKEEFDNLPPFRKTASEYQSKRLKNSLASVMRLTDYQSKSDYAPGRTTKRFNMGIKGLVRHNQNYENLTKSQKRDLTQALSHNEFDVRALPVLFENILKEHPKALDKASKPLFEI